MKHVLRTNMNPLFRNLLDLDYDLSTNEKHIAKVNISENEKGYDLQFALPGFNKDQLSVKIENEHLIVSSQIETAETKETKKYTRKEFNVTSFSRSFYLPEQIEEEKIVANYENGILDLHLPKAIKEETSKSIEIK
jgi:HSP20 family protein